MCASMTSLQNAANDPIADEVQTTIQLLEAIAADRTLQVFEIELPAHAAGEVVLRAEVVDPAEAGLRWTAWSGVELR